ncbi:MAG: hypothetical protein H6807_02680 [Planctomycetes bacterium]|nr:hypothetical protein [Planctomycetota bacterium]
MSKCPRLLLVLIVLACGLQPLVAQVEEPRARLLALVLGYELDGRIDTAIEGLRGLLPATEGELKAQILLRLARLQRRQGDTAGMEASLAPLIGRDDGIGALARGLAPRSGEASRPDGDPVFGRIDRLDLGAIGSDVEASAAAESLGGLGALAVPVLVERFDSLGIYGRLNCLELLGTHENDASVRLLFESILAGERAAESVVVLSHVRFWTVADHQLPLATKALASGDRSLREQAMLVFARIRPERIPEALVEPLRAEFDAMVARGADTLPQHEAREALLALGDLDLLRSDRAAYDRFLDEAVHWTDQARGTIARLWLDRVATDPQRLRRAIAAGPVNNLVLAANEGREQPIVELLLAGLRGDRAVHESSRARLDELGVEIPAAVWVELIQKGLADQDLGVAFDRLGSTRAEPAVSAALGLLRRGQWFGVSGSALRHLVRVAPDRLREQLRVVLDDEGGWQIFEEMLGAEPEPNRAGLVLGLMADGRFLGDRLLLTLAYGADESMVASIVDRMRLPLRVTDDSVWSRYVDALAVALDRSASSPDLQMMIEALPDLEREAGRRIEGLLDRKIGPEHRPVLLAAIDGLVLRLKAERAPAAGPVSAIGWTAERYGEVRALESLLELATGHFGGLEDLVFGLITRKELPRECREAALAGILARDDGDPGAFALRCLDRPDFDLLDCMPADLMLSREVLRARVCVFLIAHPEQGVAGEFIARLPEAEARSTGVALVEAYLKSPAAVSSVNTRYALYRIGELKDPAFVELFGRCLAQPILARDAVEQLGRMFSRRAVPALIATLKSEDEEVRSRAESWLERLESYFVKEARWSRLIENEPEAK